MTSKHWKYLIPIIGLLIIWNDIPHTEDDRIFAPLQGNEVVKIVTLSWASTMIFVGAIIFLLP